MKYGYLYVATLICVSILNIILCAHQQKVDDSKRFSNDWVKKELQKIDLKGDISLGSGYPASF